MRRFKIFYTKPNGKKDCKIVTATVPSKYAATPEHWAFQAFHKSGANYKKVDKIKEM